MNRIFKADDGSELREAVRIDRAARRRIDEAK